MWSAFSSLLYTFVLSLSLGGASSKNLFHAHINMKKTNDN